MKKLFTLIMIIISLNVNSQVNASELEETHVERIIDKYGGVAIEKFNQLIETATPMAEQGFQMVVKLQIAKGIVNLIPIILFLIFMFLFYKEYNKIANNENRKDPNYGPFDEDNITAPLLINLIISTITFIISLFTISYAILYLLAPEWYAVKEILNLI